MTRLAKRFTVGLLDYLFGKRISATIVGADGSTRTIPVTEKWLKNQEDADIADPIDLHLVPVHMLGLEGYELTSWVIGEDVEEEAWKKFRDPLTGHLTAMTLVRDGKTETFLVEKEEWFRLKEQLDAVDR